MFTARNRQNPFAKRRRAQADAEQAEASAVPFDSNKSPEHVETPDIATLATGGTIDEAKPLFVELPDEQADRLLAEQDAADELSQLGQEIEFPPTEEQTARGNVVLDVPPISAETQAKIDAIANRAIPPVAEPVADEQPAAEPEPEVKRGRGRPRPMETIVRDGKVYDLLKAADEVEGVSKEALAIALGEKDQQVYSSLRQLTKEGRAETRYVKGHGYRWFAL